MRNPSLLPCLEALKISYEIIDGSTITSTLSYLKNLGKDSKRTTFTSEQLACTYGHMLMHKRAIELGSEWALFFENDATINISFLQGILEALDSLPKGIILLGSCGGWAKRSVVLELGGLKIHKVFNSAVTGSHAYLVRIEQIPQLVSSEEDLKSLADEFIRRNLPMYITIPFISYQEGFTPSQIPLKSTGLKGGKLRMIASSLKADVLDLSRLGRLGNRCIRLEIIEFFVAKLLMKLQGCNFYYLSQAGLIKDQSGFSNP
jgi:hypothetical protein